MKKKKIILLSIIVIAILIGGMVLGNKIIKDKKINKLLNTSTNYIDNKEYDKALVTLDLILSETNNEKASKEKELISNYLKAKKDYDSKNFNEALNDINKIGDISEYKGLDDDVNSLKSKIETNIEEENKMNQSIKNIKELIDKKEYNSAKNSINDLRKNELNDKYKEEVSKLDEIVDKNIKKEEEEKAKKQKEQEIKQNQIPESKSPVFGEKTPWSKDGYTSYKGIRLPLPNGDSTQISGKLLEQICKLPIDEAFKILKNYGWSDRGAYETIYEYQNGN
ncbi:hypothetical protein [Clostridium perfringens]|uniref:hypothetical protein n=1 Tax=Clostridium perfringens TaxID=1502 RepID=UPI0034A42610